ncbi:MAG: exosortase/archaeosortase family protein [Lentisphaerae bacterium]|nr:exosortase/archaeosortase family protein [Lentisphaerota bacterium]
MNNFTPSWRSYLQRLSLPLALISAALFLFTTAKILFFTPGDGGKSLFLLLLAVATFVNSCKLLPDSGAPAKTSLRDKLLAWLLLLFFFLIFGAATFFPEHDLTGFFSTLPALLFFLAAFCFWGGIKSALIFLLPTLICTMIIPNRDVLALLFSFPLRLLSTIISVESLRLFGLDIDYHLTSIHLPDSGIAITDACSGIEQLEILLLLGYLLVKMQHTRKRWALLHYLFILPAVVLVNSIRIIITILLYYKFGQRAFADPVHITLGYLLVIAVVILLWIIGPLFPDAEANSSEQKSASDHDQTDGDRS